MEVRPRREGIEYKVSKNPAIDDEYISFMVAEMESNSMLVKAEFSSSIMCGSETELIIIC